MRKHASGNSNQVSASPATSCTVINSHLPNWARTTNGDAAQNRPPAQDVTNKLLSGSSKWQTNKLHVFPEPEQSTGDVPTLRQGPAQQRYTPSYRQPSSTPAFSTASGPLSAVPTGFSSDARRVIAGLAGPEHGTVGGSSQQRHRQQTSIRPSSNAQGTGWSALYDESSEEEDRSGLQAEESQASSLSFQPHNLFKEHFAAGPSAATPAAVLNTSVSTPAHDSTSTILSQDAAASRDSQHSLGKPRSAAVDGSTSPILSQDAAARKSPRLSSRGAKSQAASQRGQPSGVSRSPSASPRLPPGVSKGAQATQSQPREGLSVAQGTPYTPAARRRGRSVEGRGLATQLEGMQAQLDDLDAMWSAVNANKPQAASRNGAQVDEDMCSGNSSDTTALPTSKQALPSRGRISAQAAAAAAAAGLPSRHTQAQSVMSPSHPLPLSSHPGSGSINVDMVQCTVTEPGTVPSDSFPGFALLAARPGAVTAGDLRASNSLDTVSGGNADSLLFPPVPSQEAVLRPPTSLGNAHSMHKKKRASAVRATHEPSTAASKAVKGSTDQLPQHSQQSGSSAASLPRHTAVSPFSAKSPHGQLQALEHMLQSLPQRHPKAPAAPFTTRAPTPASQSIQSSFRLSFSPTGIPSVNLAQSPELQNQTQQKTEEAARAVAQAEHKAASAEDSTAADERDSVSARKNCAWPETRSAMGALEACSAEDQPGEAQLASSPADDSWAASKPHDTASQASADAVASHRQPDTSSPAEGRPDHQPHGRNIVAPSGVLSSRAAADQATPDAWPRQATPALGLSTGLSRLTTPPSAAEMHRCYPGVNDLDEFDCEEGDTVTLENPAYDNSFSHKGSKAPPPRHHTRHPLLDLGQLASNPAFESEAGALSSRHIDLTPRRPTPAPTAHPNRHTPTKIAYRPKPRTFGTDRPQRETGDLGGPQQASRDAERAATLSPSRLPVPCKASSDGMESSQSIPGPKFTPQEGAQQHALLLDKLSDVCSSSIGVQSASQTLSIGAASSKGRAQASCTPSQEVKSNSKVSSTGKSKRWSALAFWKKSAGKTKQPAEAKAAAAVNKADEELAPLRGRLSSYHSSFIALAKQGRHAKAKTNAEASAAVPREAEPASSGPNLGSPGAAGIGPALGTSGVACPGPEELATPSWQGLLADTPPTPLSSHPIDALDESQEQCQLSFEGFQQPYRRDAFRRSAQSSSSQAAAVWVPQAEMQMQSSAEGRNEAWVTRRTSADAPQQHASSMQSEEAYSRRQLLEQEMHQQCCNLQHALRLSSEHV
ncbi:hypothetical protein WJX82_010854 [Trebouxia sp. C0006]